MTEDKEKKKSFFDCLKVIVNTKDNARMEEDIREDNFNAFFVKYMILRYLSMDKTCFDLIHPYQQAIEAMSNEDCYRFLYRIIPQQRNLFIRYISKPRKK